MGRINRNTNKRARNPQRSKSGRRAISLLTDLETRTFLAVVNARPEGVE